ncbi:putative orp1 like protein [Golovinomyces cichoracearum]|uniref:Putative orp1 like protein n=1 Tax=Golovinomyces cichoracearum TaxID=62708 RepID=A0A420IMZ1_9PEZI|nr:putative orp1 like protein [Golovinomyces cichoracearum]
MKLNSMLIGNISAVDRPHIGGHKSFSNSTHSRTPWDADGYSLPIYLTALNQKDNVFEGDISAPSSLAHKTSCSKSSIFSISSNTDSSSHSRFSSVSTTDSSQFSSKNQSLCVYESPSPKTTGKVHPEIAAIEKSNFTSDQNNQRISSPHSPKKDWNIITEQPSNRKSECEYNPSSIFVASIDKKEEPSMESTEENGRPSSPSDVILFKRQQAKLCLRLATDDSGTRFLKPKPSVAKNTGNITEFDLHNVTPSVSHKRALSAPTFRQPSHQASLTNSSQIIPSIELSPPGSFNPDYTSPRVPTIYQSPATPPHLKFDLETHPIKCMYNTDCDTGSQLRKAISHIFGRNKICTRQIPGHVWVHYCRKHYQRSRYRNPKEYAKLQCDLVQQQIRRVHDWSQLNSVTGRAGVLQDWTISVRKREQKRLDDLQNGRKRKIVTLYHETEQDDSHQNTDNGPKKYSAVVPATAVPEWLLEHCRKGYSTQEILEIFSRLHHEILNDSISTFPDIEILPNIIIEQDEHWSPKVEAKRPQNAHHKRAKSLTAGLSSFYESGDSRLSYPHFYEMGTSGNRNPITRRVSSAVCNGTVDYSYQPFSRSLVSDMSRRNSAFNLHSRIEENKIPEVYESLSPLRMQTNVSNFTPEQSHSQQLQYQSLSSTSCQEITDQYFHQRSQSDFGGISHMPTSELPAYSSVYPEAKPVFREIFFDEPEYLPQSQWTMP